MFSASSSNVCYLRRHFQSQYAKCISALDRFQFVARFCSFLPLCFGFFTLFNSLYLFCFLFLSLFPVFCFSFLLYFFVNSSSYAIWFLIVFWERKRKTKKKRKRQLKYSPFYTQKSFKLSIYLCVCVRAIHSVSQRVPFQINVCSSNVCIVQINTKHKCYTEMPV